MSQTFINDMINALSHLVVISELLYFKVIVITTMCLCLYEEQNLSKEQEKVCRSTMTLFTSFLNVKFNVIPT